MSRIIVAVVVCALSSQLSWGQEASPAGINGALGYFDYSTGAFRPVGQMGEFDSEVEKADNAGTIIVNITITIKSAIPATSPISCGVLASVTDINISTGGINIISEAATVTATRTGNTAKCTVTMPYSWTGLNPASAKLNLIYNLSMGKATATTGLQVRVSSGTIANISVPANGSTTTRAVNAVL
ncbi:MAG TPA: hypothetical protein VJ725_13185 [Thermoanaerobaculia bacterium]|nr:hypothetical protein [Thermoanaerobaculia bacterium]